MTVWTDHISGGRTSLGIEGNLRSVTSIYLPFLARNYSRSVCDEQGAGEEDVTLLYILACKAQMVLYMSSMGRDRRELHSDNKD